MEVQVMMVRHGETVANRARILQGHKDYQLNNNGRLQARKAGYALEAESFDRVYTSDLSRAYETADIILQHNQAFRANPCPKHQWEILRERTFGKFESKGIDEFNAEAREFLPEGVEDLWQYKPEGGESLIELRRRSGEFFDLFAEDLADRYELGDRPLVLVVAHGVLFKELMIHLAEERGVVMPCPGKEYRKVSPNAGITRFTLTFDDQKRLTQIHCPSMYDVRHLGGMESLGIEESKKTTKPATVEPAPTSTSCKSEVTTTDVPLIPAANTAVKVR